MTTLNLNQEQLTEAVSIELERVFTEVFTKDFVDFAKAFVEKNKVALTQAVLSKVIGGETGELQGVEAGDTRVTTTARKRTVQTKKVMTEAEELADLQSRILKAQALNKVFNASTRRQANPDDKKMYQKYEVYKNFGIMGVPGEVKLMRALVLLKAVDAKPDPVPNSPGRGRPKTSESGRTTPTTKAPKKQITIPLSKHGRREHIQSGFIVSNGANTIIDGEITKTNLVVRRFQEQEDPFNALDFDDDDINDELVEEIRGFGFHPHVTILQRLEKLKAERKGGDIDEVKEFDEEENEVEEVKKVKNEPEEMDIDEVDEVKKESSKITREDFVKYELIVSEQPEIVADIDALAKHLGMSANKVQVHLLDNLGDLTKRYGEDVSEKIVDAIKTDAVKTVQTKLRRKRRAPIKK